MTREELLQTAKPILFNTESLRAILDGRKTVTRRVVKPQPSHIMTDQEVVQALSGADPYGYGLRVYPIAEEVIRKSPYQLGDVLYVRETWAKSGDGVFLYRAWTGHGQEPEKQDEAMKWLDLKWRPSIHMPRKAARLFLRVTDVRVERLQDITEEQAKAEGMPESCDYPASENYCPTCKGTGLVGTYHPETLGFMDIECPDCDTLIKRFWTVWDATFKPADRDKYGWAANPWVWTVEFERVIPHDDEDA